MADTTEPLLQHPTASKRHLTDPDQLATTNGKPTTPLRHPLQTSQPRRLLGQASQSALSPLEIDPSSQRDAKDTTPLKLNEFYELVGMVPPDKDGKPPKNLEAPHGLYAYIRQKERNVARRYQTYDYVMTCLLIVQLILSAIFIVLGAINVDHHVTIAALGAVSTVVAGILALAKGQGQPNRYRMERDGLRKVLFEADELYWDVNAGRNVIFSDIKKLREGYLKVVSDAQKNHPDFWQESPQAQETGKGATGSGKGATGKGSGPKMPPGLV